MTGTATILRADARALPLPDASVDLICTSPPYYSLRDYRDGDGSLAGQIGAEPSPAEYIAALIDCTREWVRVLKPSGSLFVNLGDKYSGSSGGGAPSASSTLAGNGHVGGGPKLSSLAPAGPVKRSGVPAKSLMLLPERYRIAAVDQLGLIARAVIVWSKPNGLPESVTDRVRRSHEDWVHLTREPRYYSAVDEIREPHAPNYGRKYPNGPGGQGGNRDRRDGGIMTQRTAADLNPLGKLPGSVWEIATEPLRVPNHLGIDHFAAFPSEWPRRIILGWSPPGICVECGEGRRPGTATSLTRDRGGRKESVRDMGLPNSGRRTSLGRERTVSITGYSCACPEPTAPTRPAVVLDSFAGTGTVALVAMALGRHGISVDRSADYCRLARWRTTDPGQLARAMRVPAPPPVQPAQAALFDLGGGRSA